MTPKNRLSRTIRARLLPSLWTALPLATVLFLSGPLLIYLPNSRTFPYMLSRLLAIFAPAALAAWLLLALLLAALPQRYALRQRFAALALAAAALLWLQAHLINWRYGVLDGRDIPWAELAWRGWVDGALWLTLLAAAWAWAKPLLRRGAELAGGLLLLQALSLAVLFMQHPEARQAKNFMLFDESEGFRFSAVRNAVVLISDGFQSDLFQEILDEEPAWRDTFAGFTYFRNSLAGYPLTMPSVPFLLTARRCTGERPFADYLSEAYRAPTSVLQSLRRAGWRTDILMEAGSSFDKDPALISNLRRGQVPLTNRQAGFLFDLSLFRHAPHFLKRVVYAGQRWRFARYLRDRRTPRDGRLTAAHNPLSGRRFPARALEELADLRFLAELQTGAGADVDVPVFKLFHLKGVHPPLQMDERLEFRPLRSNRNSWKRVGRGSLAIIRQFLTRLRELGVLDDAMIFVIGDHGASLGQFGLRLPPGWPQTSGPVSESVRAAGLPLVLVKRPGDGGPLRTSDAPVSLGDLPATLLQALGIPCPGASMFAIPEQAVRQRRFAYFVWAPGDSAKPTLPPLSEYVVDGHSWLAGSWRAVAPTH